MEDLWWQSCFISYFNMDTPYRTLNMDETRGSTAQDPEKVVSTKRQNTNVFVRAEKVKGVSLCG